MGLTERLAWPKDFKQLVSDRRAKGFNVVQLVAGLYSDMDSFDPRGKNEAGFPWKADYKSINPAWWDLEWNTRLKADRGGPDWVLVIDAAELNYPPPGVQPSGR